VSGGVGCLSGTGTSPFGPVAPVGLVFCACTTGVCDSSKKPAQKADETKNVRFMSNRSFEYRGGSDVVKEFEASG
jgi:hypothetical protein